jgi:peptidoglycan/LPS O-acetylase OafA/YrhL
MIQVHAFLMSDRKRCAMNLRDVPNLDFVRSIAVISVVVEHTLLALGVQQIGVFPVQYIGVLGVLVFFVLTSLVLMWSLERRPSATDFFIRRFFRIYPLSLTAMAVVLLLHAPTGGTVTHFFAYADPSPLQIAVQAMLLNATPRVCWALRGAFPTKSRCMCCYRFCSGLCAVTSLCGRCCCYGWQW